MDERAKDDKEALHAVWASEAYKAADVVEVETSSYEDEARVPVVAYPSRTMAECRPQGFLYGFDAHHHGDNIFLARSCGCSHEHGRARRSRSGGFPGRGVLILCAAGCPKRRRDGTLAAERPPNLRGSKGTRRRGRCRPRGVAAKCGVRLVLQAQRAVSSIRRRSASFSRIC